MLEPEPALAPAAVSHWIVGDVPVTPIESVALPPEEIDDGLAVGCDEIAAGTHIVTVTSPLVRVDEQELLMMAW
jgi:hypothetical protein